MVKSSAVETRDSLPTTGQTVRTYCQAQGLPLESVELQVAGYPSAFLHFIDTSSTAEDDVLLYLHGGAYFFPLSSPALLQSMQTVAALSSRRLVVLEYTLCPATKYPGQLAQCVAAMQYLLKTRKPAQLVVAGDSAGGNLMLGLLAHMQQPHPSIEALDIQTSDKLAAAICISARTGIDATASSYDYNADKDIMGRHTMKAINETWRPDRGHVWAVPVRGDRSFWRDVKVERMLLLAGADEVYVDDVREFADLVGAEEAGSRMHLKICPGEIHDQWALDLGLGIEDGVMTTSLLEWAKTI